MTHVLVSALISVDFRDVECIVGCTGPVGIHFRVKVRFRENGWVEIGAVIGRDLLLGGLVDRRSGVQICVAIESELGDVHL